jgi:tetratricopeptide (TPR) repeat protein
MDQFCRDQLEFANKLIFVKRYEEADRVLKTVLASDIGSEESLIHLRRIELMSLLGKLSEVATHYLQLSETRDDDGLSETCHIMTRMFEDPNNHAEHITSLQQVAQQYGPSPLLFFALGFGGEQQGSFERAKYNYEQCLNMDPQWYPSLFGLSQIHCKGSRRIQN